MNFIFDKIGWVDVFIFHCRIRKGITPEHVNICTFPICQGMLLDNEHIYMTKIGFLR